MASNDFMIAATNRSIRTIKAELAFLTDASVISQTELSSILTQLPREEGLHAPIPLQTVPAAPNPVLARVNGISNQDEKKLPNGGCSPFPSIAASTPTQQSHPPPAYPVAPEPPLPALTYATALYAYTPSDAGDLSLKPKDRIAVTEYMNAEWWKGRSERTREEGIFPRSYVKVEEKPPQPTRTDTGSSYGNMPMDVSQGGSSMAPGEPGQPGKIEAGGKKFGKKMGNATIFGAGAAMGGNIVNSIF